MCIEKAITSRMDVIYDSLLGNYDCILMLFVLVLILHSTSVEATVQSGWEAAQEAK